MSTSRFVIALFSAVTMVVGTSVASGQDYPNKVIRIIAGGAGGGSDFAARLVAQGISGPLGQSVIVDNRGSGIIGREIVARAAPDGYTLLVGGDSTWLGPLLQKMPYDAVRDYSPIALLTTSPNILVVHPSLPVKSVKDLIALAKSRPGALNYTSNGIGGSSHLAAELFKDMAGVKIQGVNYQSAVAALSDLISGHVQLTFATPTSVTPHIKSGRLRALAVTSARPSALYPDLPTVASSGLPGYETASHNFIVAPAKTPATIINRLSQEIVRHFNTAETKQRFLSTGAESVGSSPEELAAKIKSEIAKWGKVIKDAGIREDGAG